MNTEGRIQNVFATCFCTALFLAGAALGQITASQDAPGLTTPPLNFVNLKYKPFDASDRPLYDSGLIGPVTLTALTPASPDREGIR